MFELGCVATFDIRQRWVALHDMVICQVF